MTNIPAMDCQPTRFETVLLGKNVVLLYKAAGADLSYESVHWINTNTTLNETLENNAGFNGRSAKFDAANTLPVKELLFLCSNGCYSHVRVPSIPSKPLVELIAHCQNSNSSIVLEFLGGMEHPLFLAIGQAIPDSSVKEVRPSFRIQAKNNSQQPFGARIGGFFTKLWDDSYGADILNNKCSAEVAGFGITDCVYQPYLHARKSFGIRQAHDRMEVGNQLSIECHIYAIV